MVILDTLNNDDCDGNVTEKYKTPPLKFSQRTQTQFCNIYQMISLGPEMYLGRDMAAESGGQNNICQVILKFSATQLCYNTLHPHSCHLPPTESIRPCFALTNIESNELSDSKDLKPSVSLACSILLLQASLTAVPCTPYSDR